ncbi:MAG: DUF177 domain-containing protein [Alphaproteobacteria bacterium]|nr:DUF177 domain-containing protein [Alphaproteobacteria bacterium]
MVGQPEPEFSFIVHPSELTDKEVKYDLSAESDECNALAERFGLQAIETFNCTLSVKFLRREKAIRLRGKLHAKVVQSCVVSMVSVENVIEDEFEILFREETQIDSDETDDVVQFEPYSGDLIDVGEIASEELALMLDPYPRSPEIADQVLGPYLPGPEDPTTKPFAALAALKRTK